MNILKQNLGLEQVEKSFLRSNQKAACTKNVTAKLRQEI